MMGNDAKISAAVRFVFILLAAAAVLGSCVKAETRKAYYFYEIVCPACEESKAQEALGGQAYYWSSKQKNMEFKSYDVFHTPGAIEELRALYEKYKIDEYSVTLPILFVGDVWYVGREAIGAVVNGVE